MTIFSFIFVHAHLYYRQYLHYILQDVAMSVIGNKSIN